MTRTTRKRVSGGRLLLSLIFALGIGGVVWFAFYANVALDLPRIPMEFSIRHGSTLKAAANQMVGAEVLRNPWAFVVLARLLGKESEIKAGNYQISEPISPLGLLAKVTRGDYAQSEITLIEGWTFRQIRKALDENPALKHDTAGMDDQQILAAIGATESSPEGLFFPDTYFFGSGARDLDVLARAYRTMRTRLADLWPSRSANLPLASPYEALILASIVEKETGKAGDRPLVARVFVNRLKLGMKLQTDPSVIYGLGVNFDGNLKKRDLTADGPYNTYTRAGLPPTPIAIPGMASLTATLNPADSQALYFVARGDGSSEFSNTLSEHNRAVAKYQRGGAATP